MGLLDLEVMRTGSSELICEQLPDGSAAIFEVATKNVYSLNPSAAAAWDACASATTLSRVAIQMSARLGTPVTEDLAHEAVAELVAVGLVRVAPAEQLGTSRREMLKQVAGVALPVVLVLTGAEQRAHAQGTGSTPSIPTTAPVTTIPPFLTSTTPAPPGPFSFEFRKHFGDPPQALAGAVFDVHSGSASGPVVLSNLVTDAQGVITGQLPGGTYVLVEKSAPGGPWAPLAQPFTLPSVISFFDLDNVPLGTTAV